MLFTSIQIGLNSTREETKERMPIDITIMNSTFPLFMKNDPYCCVMSWISEKKGKEAKIDELYADARPLVKEREKEEERMEKEYKRKKEMSTKDLNSTF